MKTKRLTRYLAADAAFRCTGTLALFLLVYSAIDLVEAQALPGAPVGLATLYLYKLPGVFFHVLPLALTVGVQLTLANLKTTGEWDAVRSAGISPFSLLPGFMIVPLVAFAASLYVGTTVAPRGIAKWQDGFDQQPENPDNDRRLVAPTWSAAKNVFIKRHGRFETVVARGSTGRPVSWTRAPVRGPGARGWGWRFDRGWVREQAVPLGLGGDDPPRLWRAYRGSVAALRGASLTITEIFEAIPLLVRKGLDPAPFRAELALRAAVIAACLVLPFFCLGFSMGLREKRATRLTGIGIAAGVLYWLALAVSWNGATMGLWSPYWTGAALPLTTAGVGAVGAGLITRRH